MLAVFGCCCFYITRRFGPLWGQTSSSCGGVVAFGQQMGAHRPPWLVKLRFGALHAPPYSSCGGLMAFVHGTGAMFVYGFGCLFVLFIMEHPQEVSLKFLRGSDLIWLRYLGSKCLFLCLFGFC